jgi:hypothetical protein
LLRKITTFFLSAKSSNSPVRLSVVEQLNRKVVSIIIDSRICPE